MTPCRRTSSVINIKRSRNLMQELGVPKALEAQEKATLCPKHSALVNRKRVIIFKTTPDFMSESDQGDPHTLRWEISLLSPYSPDIAPANYHLFLDMDNHLHE
ncbi:hypothetical protein NPIL_687941 [Nephila pilipes]|uniref:Uncharacterized protein n=1 Tax=Nephila pilipes TaxID=299642 RepID=A0A8X6TEU2_NEPPI|nr:hypothetical protein NPIL_687941 [Nephila pilipes]